MGEWAAPEWPGCSVFQDIGPELPRANATDILQPHAMNHFRAGFGLISRKGRKSSLVLLAGSVDIHL